MLARRGPWTVVVVDCSHGIGCDGCSQPRNTCRQHPRDRCRSHNRLAIAGRRTCVRGWLQRSRPITTARLSQPIEGTSDAQGSSVHHVQINHRCRYVGMTEQFLHRPDVVAVLEQMRREAVTKRVATRVLRETSTPNGFGHRFLDDRFVRVKPRGWTPFRIPTDPRRRKHELPAPLCRRARVLAIERERQHDAPFATREVAINEESSTLVSSAVPDFCVRREPAGKDVFSASSASSALIVVA
jgi:hypothetical protein